MANLSKEIGVLSKLSAGTNVKVVAGFSSAREKTVNNFVIPILKKILKTHNIKKIENVTRDGDTDWAFFIEIPGLSSSEYKDISKEISKISKSAEITVDGEESGKGFYVVYTGEAVTPDISYGKLKNAKNLLKSLIASQQYNQIKFNKLKDTLNKKFKQLHKNSFVDFGSVHIADMDVYGKDLKHTILVQTHDLKDDDFIDNDKYLNDIIKPIAKKFGFGIDTVTQGSGSLGAKAVEIGFTPYESVLS